MLRHAILAVALVATVAGCGHLSRHERHDRLRSGVSPMMGRSKQEVLDVLGPCEPHRIRDGLEQYDCRYYYGRDGSGQFNKIRVVFKNGSADSWTSDL